MPKITATKEDYDEMLLDLAVLENLLSDVGTKLYLKFGAPRCGGLMIGLTACLEAQDVLQCRMDRDFSADGIEVKRLTEEAIARKKAMLAEKRGRKDRSKLKKQIEDVVAQESNPEVSAVLSDKLNRKRKPSLFDLLPPADR